MCHYDLLAGGPLVSVHGCDCGLIHLSGGGITVHLTEAGIRELHRSVGSAVTELDRRKRELEISLDIRFALEGEG